MNLLAKKLGKETKEEKKSNKLCPSLLSAGDASLLGFVSGTLRERESESSLLGASLESAARFFSLRSDGSAKGEGRETHAHPPSQSFSLTSRKD